LPNQPAGAEETDTFNKTPVPAPGDWQQAEKDWTRLARAPVIIAKLAPGEQATINAPALAGISAPE
jgi:hypothetical protein